jgi:hypothetical protein
MKRVRWMSVCLLCFAIVLGVFCSGCASETAPDSPPASGGAPVAPSQAQPPEPETEPEPQEAQEETLEWKLAVIQHGASTPKSGAEVQQFKTLLDSIESKTKNSRQECADMSVKAWQLVNEEGVQDELLYTMQQLDIALVEGDIKWDLAEIAAAYITLRTSQ